MMKHSAVQRLFAPISSRRSSVSVLAAVMFPTLIGMVGLATEYGDALLTQVKAQRIADAAAWGGALGYKQSPTTAAITAAANRIATLNGIPTSELVAALVSSPSADGNNAVQATVTIDVPLGLSRVINSSNTQLAVTANSYVELKTVGQACIVGLASTAGTNSVLEDGGATVTGSGCLVAAKKNLSISGGATMTALAVYAGGTVSTSGGATLTTTPTAGNITQNYAGSITDPVASNLSVSSAFTNLSSLSGTVSNPTTPASAVTLAFAWSPSGAGDPTFPYYSGVGGVYNKGTLPCSAGSYALRSISVSGGVSVHISATAGCNYTVTNGISNQGNLLQIDGTAGSWYVNGGVSAGSSTMALNGGTFWIGSGISVGGGGSLTLANSSTIYVSGGITTGGNSTTNLIANTYRIAGAVNMAGTVNWRTTGSGPTTEFFSTLSLGSGGGTFTFGDGTYSVNGNTVLSSGPSYFGNSLLSINGNLTVSSGASLCGTPAPCGSGTSHMTIIDSGTNTFAGGSIINIQAPATGASTGIPGVAVASNYTGAVGTWSQYLGGGTNGTYSGVFYFPNSSVELSGGAHTASSTCFELVANQIYMSGGSSTSTSCSGFGGQIGALTALLVK